MADSPIPLPPPRPPEHDRGVGRLDHYPEGYFRFQLWLGTGIVWVLGFMTVAAVISFFIALPEEFRWQDTAMMGTATLICYAMLRWTRRVIKDELDRRRWEA